MRPKIEAKSTSGDGIKWLLVWVLMGAAVYADLFFAKVAWALRMTGGIVITAIILAIASQTAKGQAAWGLMKGSKIELKKVLWPTRQEAVQTTAIVVTMVVVIALILWGMDALFLWIISGLTGQRG